ncbi:MAG: class I tRNA ligase family protein, partial [Coriobacteriales bacterium]|nr:class I tRNA ligase family protein [Coriobacteriales bacterium]
MSDNQQRGEALTYPTRAVVTAGMPYGNKTLHFGHIGGVFVPADCFARFLRMRIGYANVLFVSGTDCYGSPIDEAYRKLRENGDFDGSEADYVVANHAAQSQVMRDYDISLDIFEGSGIGASAAIHQALSQKLVERLYQGGFLQLEETEQFYDEKAETFLNGRQVRGRCPVQGCKSSVAYADECELGHQYLPVELIAPKSTVSGDTPALRKVANWYFDLPRFMSFLQNYCTEQEANGTTRELVLKTIREFLVPPVLYLKNELEEDYRALAGELPP